MLGYGWIYIFSLMIAASIAGLHVYWIRGRDRELCFKAFLHNTWIGATVFIGIALEVLL